MLQTMLPGNSFITANLTTPISIPTKMIEPLATNYTGQMRELITDSLAHNYLPFPHRQIEGRY